MSIVRARAAAVRNTLSELKKKVEVKNKKPIGIQVFSRVSVQLNPVVAKSVLFRHRWTQGHFVATTGAQTLATRALQTYDTLAGLHSYYAGGYGWALDSDHCYDESHGESFDAHLTIHRADLLNHYRAVLDLADDLSRPSHNRVVDRPEWRTHFSTVSHIYALLLGMIRPLPIEESDRHLAPRCVIMVLPDNPDSITVPAGGKKEFERFEAQFIRTYQPGGPNAEIRTAPDGQKYLAPIKLFDPFTIIGSSYMML